MEVTCRFPNCAWTGSVPELYNHCESCHQQFILTINEENTFTIDFVDFLRETFLLVSSGGLYWLLLDPYSRSADCVRRGIVPIGMSEISEYTVKCGRTGDACITYVGPCQMESVWSPTYDLEFPVPHIVEHTQMQIFFGSYCDSDVCMIDDIVAEEMEVEVEAKTKQFDDDLINNNFKCLVCYDEDWSTSTCPICRPDVCLDFFDTFDEDQLIKSLTQFSEITEMMMTEMTA